MREYYSRRHRLLGECDGDGDIQAAKRDCKAPPTRDFNVW